MKHSWKLCVIFLSMFIVVVLGAFCLLSGVMASADQEKKEFSTSGSAGESIHNGVSDSAIQKGKDSGDSSSRTDVSIAHEKNKLPLGEQIAIFAEFWKGVPYMYGGATLPEVEAVGWLEKGKGPDPKIDRGDGRGVDSSGFVQAVLQYYNIAMPRSCKDQERIGEVVPIKDIEAGDIVFYGSSNYEIHHCGICTGDGRVVHSSPKAGKVIISDINYRKIVSVTRVTGTLVPGTRESE